MLNPTIQAPAQAEAGALAAAAALGAALKASPEFTALLAADQAISLDPEAEAAIAAFDRLQQQLRTEITTGLLQESQRAELAHCQQALYAVPSVAAYVAATEAFEAVCRETASIVSTEIGMDFAANSRSGGCCG
ncbi:MAG: YlbF family regulator [Actinobacteria bacterium]|nr:YlbF family regulator [Actinomycetota bacterium]